MQAQEKKETFVHESKVQQIILCTTKRCVFGKKKMDDYCNTCVFHKPLNIGEIEPLIIKLVNKIEYSCDKNPKNPLLGPCPFGFEKPSEICLNCHRIRREKVLKSETEVIK